MFDGGEELLPLLAAAPGPVLAETLAGVALDAVSDAELLACVGGWERLIAWATSQQARAVSAFAQRRPSRDAWIDEFAVSELATELTLTSAGATNKVTFAQSLEELPLTAAALSTGQIDARRAQVIIDGVSSVDASVAAAVEAHVMPRAACQTTGQLRAAVARAVIAADPSGADRRHARARQDRRVTIKPAPEGMASLWALLPAEAAVTVRDALNRVAREDRVDGDTRSMDNRRADALVRLCAGDIAVGASEVRVVIDAGTLFKLRQEPASLCGYGPIPPTLARTLAADARWRRMIVAPETAELLDLGRRTYRPSNALAAFVKARDLMCRFPGCRRPAREDDLDHVIEFPRGETIRKNLIPLCRRHHRLKTHAKGWRVRRTPDGTVWWTTPTGRTIVVESDPDQPGAQPWPEKPEQAPADDGFGAGLDDLAPPIDAAMHGAASAARPPDPQPPPDDPPF